MRNLKAEEQEKVFKKLKKFIGENTEKLLKGHRLFLHKQKVFHVSDELEKNASSIPKDDLVSIGSCLGRFTKSMHFKLTITSLHVLSKYALHKVWLKNSAEMNFLYANNILKSHILKMSEDVPINANVFVFNQNDLPLGFGVTAKGSTHLSNIEGNTLVVLHQADTGEYIRDEERIV
ncbi:ribosome biogenesis protein Nip7 [Hamiltosporidium magnivora]|uniref:60S ribosome subunit biogenesis protein NIP7 n=1 Tax=Hamiltosporidium magnivora TaxID=148818 RepID=A0A4Q9LHA5_9MICR|nr:ribosome biogenesis protein Nip7 [Hamiltosporidium magnivora]TBU07499.1 ribosome biogenesis protein Nip7 [Hamiltosporidium magnivora]